MHKVTTKLTYYLPDGIFCNIDKEHCRFCVKHKNGYTCAIHQEQLQAVGKVVNKCQGCLKGCPKMLEEKSPAEPEVDTFVKMYQNLRASGITEAEALKIAKTLL